MKPGIRLPPDVKNAVSGASAPGKRAFDRSSFPDMPGHLTEAENDFYPSCPSSRKEG